MRWLRLRKHVEEIHRIAGRPLRFLELRQPSAWPALWDTAYCCTSVYFWTAVITEDVCREPCDDADKLYALREAFARIVEETQGVVTEAMGLVQPEGNPIRRRALSDLKRVVDLYRGLVDDRFMIYPEYREAVSEDGRAAPAGNKWRLKREASYEILLTNYLAANVLVAEAAKPQG